MDKSLRSALVMLLMIVSLTGYSQVTSSNQEPGIPLAQVLEEISQKFDHQISFKPEWAEGIQFQGDIQNLDLGESLRAALRGTGLIFTEVNDRIYVLRSYEISIFLSGIIGANLTQEERASAERREISISREVTTYQVGGKVIDPRNDEPLIGASVIIADKIEAITDVNGEFQLGLPVGRNIIRIVSTGFSDLELDLNVNSDISETFQMFEKSVALDEVVVSANSARETIEDSQTSVEVVNIESIKDLPNFMGEVDVVQAVTALPGVTTTGEGAGGFNVRGGNVDENLILYDNIPIFNSSHLFGFFSVFNGDVIEKFELYKGGIPANYGGGISSILNVTSKTGDFNKLRIQGSIGLIASTITVDGPIKENKSSFLVSARAAYPTYTLSYFPDEDIRNSRAGFQDLNARVVNKLSDDSELELSAYYSSDRFSFAQDTLYRWNNLGYSLKWNKRLSDSRGISVSLSQSHYNNIIEGDRQFQEFNYQTGINFTGLRAKYLITSSRDDFTEFGVQSSLFQFASGEIEPTTAQSSINPFALDKERGLETAIYATMERHITNRLSVQPGLRVVHFASLGDQTVYGYEDPSVPSFTNISDTTNFSGIHNGSVWLEPRASIRYSLGRDAALKLGFHHMRQNVNVISITSAVAPGDFWKLRDPNLPETSSNQISLGYSKLFGSMSLTAETYYKRSKNALDYRDGGDIFLNEAVETALLRVDGRSYGAELKLEKSGRLNGWVSYTFSRAFRFNENISNAWYPAQFDRLHNLNISAVYRIRKRTSLSTNIVINSGRAITIPATGYLQGDQFIVQFSERNGGRTPGYHRADLSLTMDGNYKKSGYKSKWVFSIYNIYGRRNPYSIYFDTIGNGRLPQGYKLSILGNAFPSISYKFSIL